MIAAMPSDKPVRHSNDTSAGTYACTEVDTAVVIVYGAASDLPEISEELAEALVAMQDDADDCDNYWTTREGWESLAEIKRRSPAIVAPRSFAADRMVLRQLPRPDG